ncbi:uncharacterized protein LOC106424252 [Brassica napus]|uniref:uncharacterized protein LOC106424252 n=1 Tax=Brassica napus TaxID=3708 RepID=UPI0006AAAE59|nr:uncharacterized protein LOC106424252 [Brassica napus]
MAWVSWDDMTQTKSNGGLGFRDFQSFNNAYLAKLSWRLLNNPNSLLAQTLFGKYCKDEEFLQCPGNYSESHGWRGILIGRDLLLENMGWLVGDGKAIKAWPDPWLSLTNQVRPMGPALEWCSYILVSDLLDPDTREWNRDLIRLIFPSLETTILSMKPSRLGASDKLKWLHTKDGEFSTKTGYSTALEARSKDSDRPRPSVNWNRGVWNLKTAPKVQHVIWKALKGALPVGEKLLARQVPIDPLCKRCGKLESINHLLFHCEFAEKVWKQAPFLQYLDQRGLLYLETDWMGLVELTCLRPVGIVATQLAPWLICSLWTSRNNMIFNNKIVTIEEVISRAISSAKEWKNAQGQDEPKKPSQRKIEDVPHYDTVLQTDAAWTETTGTTGLGWAIKTARGTQRFSNSTTFVTSPLMAESLAMREAIKKSKELGIRSLRCESDSSQLIKALSSSFEPLEIYGIISDIKIEASSFDVISFCWIPRERNVDGDSLAKAALRHVTTDSFS